jgi:hypothetical protein
VGGADIWDISDLYTQDAAIAPQATATLDEALIWRGHRGTYHYDGGVVKRITNILNEDWIIRNINSNSIYHSFAYADQENEEVYIHFPTGSEAEPSDYVILSNIGQAAQLGITADFTLGQMDRTAAQRPAMYKNKFFMVDGTTTYSHFTRGTFSASWYAETAFGMAGKGEQRIIIDKFFPDSNQSGDITLEIITREHPQDADRSMGTWTITSTTQVMSVKAAGRLVKLKFSGSTEATIGFWTYNIRFLGRNEGRVV